MADIIPNIMADITRFYELYDNSLFLNKDIIDNLTSNFDYNYLNTNITAINNITNSIIHNYNELDKSIKKDNLSLNIEICILLNKYVVYIYTTIKIFTDIKNKQPRTTRNSLRSTKRSKIDISSVYISFTFDVYINNIIQKFNFEILNIPIKNKEYILDLNNFRNEDIQMIDQQKCDISRFNLNYIDDNNYIIKFIKNYIIYINDNIYIKNKHNYITIPQYEYICWFVSIITGITYSDMSKKLLLNNERFRNNDNYQEFNDFIFNIIDNITKSYKKYNNPLNKDCPIFKYLKDKPIYILRYLILNYGKNNCIQIIDKILDNWDYSSPKKFIDEYLDSFFDKLDEIIKYNYFLNNYIEKNDFKEIIESILKESSYNSDDNFISFKKNIQDKLKNTLDKITIDDINLSQDSCTLSHYIDTINIISLLYELLNVSTLSCNLYKYNDEIKISPLNEVITSSPDVILLNVINSNEKLSYTQKLFEFNDDYTEITYNSNTYILDYIINISSDNFSSSGCAHCISAIHYENQEYFHNAMYSTKNISCNDNDKDIIIPCTLIKQDWSKNAYKDLYYELHKCSYIEKPNSRLPSKDKNIFSDSFIFKLTTKNTYVYVKKIQEEVVEASIITGGNKKINYIYNNKTYKRTLYSSKNKYYIIIDKKKIYINKNNLPTS